MPRVFAGITAPIDLSRELKSYRQAIDHEKWTHKVDYHLTLAFLGSVEESALAGILDALSSVSTRHKAFEFTVDEFGAFPDNREAQVFWAGNAKKNSELLSLGADVRDEFTTRGIIFDEKPFLPHVTLSRIKRGGDLRDRIKKFNRQVIPVSQLVLFSTRPSDEVPRYSKLFEFPLKT